MNWSIVAISSLTRAFTLNSFFPIHRTGGFSHLASNPSSKSDSTSLTLIFQLWIIFSLFVLASWMFKITNNREITVVCKRLLHKVSISKALQNVTQKSIKHNEKRNSRGERVTHGTKPAPVPALGLLKLKQFCADNDSERCIRYPQCCVCIWLEFQKLSILISRPRLVARSALFPRGKKLVLCTSSEKVSCWRFHSD